MVKSDEAIIIKNNLEGYKVGVAISSLGSYKNIPIFAVKDIDGYGNFLKFRRIEEVNDFMIKFFKEKFSCIFPRQII